MFTSIHKVIAYSICLTSFVFRWGLCVLNANVVYDVIVYWHKTLTSLIITKSYFENHPIFEIIHSLKDDNNTLSIDAKENARQNIVVHTTHAQHRKSKCFLAHSLGIFTTHIISSRAVYFLFSYIMLQFSKWLKN